MTQTPLLGAPSCCCFAPRRKCKWQRKRWHEGDENGDTMYYEAVISVAPSTFQQ